MYVGLDTATIGVFVLPGLVSVIAWGIAIWLFCDTSTQPTIVDHLVGNSEPEDQSLKESNLDPCSFNHDGVKKV